MTQARSGAPLHLGRFRFDGWEFFVCVLGNIDMFYMNFVEFFATSRAMSLFSSFRPVALQLSPLESGAYGWPR